MRLFLFPLFISGVCAGKYNIFDHLNASNLVPGSDCPPLYYGLNCKVPYCYPPGGSVQRGVEDLFCKCKKNFLSGAHCELIDCNKGVLSNSTLRCECPDNAWGDYCEWTISKLLADVIVVFYFGLFLALIGTVYHAFIQPTTSTNNLSSTPPAPTNSGIRNQQNRTRRNTPQPPAPPAPAPEIRIVERVVYRENSDAPPAYDVAVASADPPKYTV
uniref:EGF-like domain-containing protein n=1 Tax=Panagrellus redivivus TaxID=6233 RepID=A0A7E4ZUZ4_PANRE